MPYLVFERQLTVSWPVSRLLEAASNCNMQFAIMLCKSLSRASSALGEVFSQFPLECVACFCQLC